MKKTLTLFFAIVLLYGYEALSLETSAKQAILVEFSSGDIIFKKNKDQKISPASLTKIMTSIIVFDLIKKGEIKLDEKFIVSNKAWRMSKQGYSSMFIMPNDRISVENLLRGIIVASGNDACVTLAEGIAGSETTFASMMNDRAKTIGMANTNFSNASGIFSENNYSTVNDIALMSAYLIKNFPKLYRMYSEKKFTWDRTGGNPISQSNRNNLLNKNKFIDGIKTGHLSDSGYSLAASIKVNNRRVLSVLSGTNSSKERSKESLKLLNFALITTDLLKIKKNNPLFVANVWNSKNKIIKLKLEKDYFITYPKRRSREVKLSIVINEPIKVKFKKNDSLGLLMVKGRNGFKKEYPLLASEDFKEVNFIKKFFNSINFLIWG
jgi:D-alanyl-D-alanine carboxypeptidase (penicillin-binding protein 5/6)